MWASTAVAQPAPATDEPNAPPTPGSSTSEAAEPLQPLPSEPLTLATGDLTPTRREHEWRPPQRRRWRDGVAGGVAFGVILVEGLERGYYGRVEIGGYDIQTRRRGWIVGMLTGIEGWGAPATGDERNWGGSLPLVIYAGIQSDAAFAVLGAGFDVLLVDRIDGDTGVGLFGPQAAANVGLDLEGVRFLLDARASYRWQMGADDRGAVRLGGAIHLTTD